MSDAPWQKAEVAGTKRALPLVKPEVVLAMLKRSKHPILVVGHKIVEIDLDGKKLIDFVIDIAKAGEIPIVATAHSVKEFLNREFQSVASMPVMDVANRLTDPEWKGLDGKGTYDLAFFIGLPYYMEWLILSGLKNFSGNLQTISLDGFYQPNATWSIPNISSKELREFFEALILKLGGQ
ncbi:MAG: CO dehydrogenase/acetyl-CoA synthase complex subunit epsilon [Candidatus Bathyarchaeota archaeon]|nr:CO dehydrogenase/acetyl-CoA synthase complex subunit epsilon [Candidatus Bathyarchaeota archaeon]